jgi:hypothetical protein
MGFIGDSNIGETLGRYRNACHREFNLATAQCEAAALETTEVMVE